MADTSADTFDAGRLEIARGDITRLDVSAIVNAANEALAPGGGVCGAIHRGAGPGLAAACREIGGCPTGEARLTPGFGLRAEFVIHAVGPRWHGGTSGEEHLLAACYTAALELAAGAGVASVAFPAISTGIYGYPLEAATKTAVRTVREFTRTHDEPTRIVFCCFSPADTEVYRRVLAGEA
ncbi:MAG: O-acetyl-ADP-ribose deacetylase [Acidimicrobiia bacterium]|nr:O-acetyl-ADP-ribose deacetylase [Acidimicrobiia bacterium]